RLTRLAELQRAERDKILNCATRTKNVSRFRERDREFESVSLLRGVCEPSVPKLRSPVCRLCAEAAALLSRLHDTRPLSNLATHRKRAIMAVNATGVFFGIKHAISAMIANGGGSIVNLSSIAGIIGSEHVHIAYNASKAAVRLMTKWVAVQHGKA